MSGENRPSSVSPKFRMVELLRRQTKLSALGSSEIAQQEEEAFFSLGGSATAALGLERGPPCIETGGFASPSLLNLKALQDSGGEQRLPVGVSLQDGQVPGHLISGSQTSPSLSSLSAHCSPRRPLRPLSVQSATHSPSASGFISRSSSSSSVILSPGLLGSSSLGLTHGGAPSASRSSVEGSREDAEEHLRSSLKAPGPSALVEDEGRQDTLGSRGPNPQQPYDERDVQVSDHSISGSQTSPSLSSISAHCSPRRPLRPLSAHPGTPTASPVSGFISRSSSSSSVILSTGLLSSSILGIPHGASSVPSASRPSVEGGREEVEEDLRPSLDGFVPRVRARPAPSLSSSSSRRDLLCTPNPAIPHLQPIPSGSGGPPPPSPLAASLSQPARSRSSRESAVLRASSSWASGGPYRPRGLSAALAAVARHEGGGSAEVGEVLLGFSVRRSRATQRDPPELARAETCGIITDLDARHCEGLPSPSRSRNFLAGSWRFRGIPGRPKSSPGGPSNARTTG
eukprot:RCo029732